MCIHCRITSSVGMSTITRMITVTRMIAGTHTITIKIMITGTGMGTEIQRTTDN